MQKTITFKTMFCLIITCLACPALAYPCQDTSRVQQLADTEGRRVAEHYQGTRDIRVSVVSCDWDGDNRRYTIEMYTYWKGSLTGDTYNVDGILSVNGNGSNPRYKETYRNQKVKDWIHAKMGFSAVMALMENANR